MSRRRKPQMSKRERELRKALRASPGSPRKWGGDAQGREPFSIDLGTFWTVDGHTVAWQPAEAS